MYGWRRVFVGKPAYLVLCWITLGSAVRGESLKGDTLSRRDWRDEDAGLEILMELDADCCDGGDVADVRGGVIDKIFEPMLACRGLLKDGSTKGGVSASPRGLVVVMMETGGVVPYRGLV
jgi:hypothetical protein